MVQKRKIGLITAIAPFLVATAIFAVSANAADGNEGKDDPSVMKSGPNGVSKEEFMKHHQWMFEQNDANKNGYLDADEMKNLHNMVKKMHERFEHKH
ncbi:hypothetical protein W03_01160 [Nitrosomonas sp. PY1]|uniref:hypothetical protein n=1 Tax=Nitrosomonas sp. PY1 TaxID=1803906 RepID=UPI001FC8B69E|nr:hypothetical protein [Nitrosomonas sp. PY1]GKS68112.1 hypothetical protein W03_01160 [Nitrosomonas sp. PY1]